jgi:O-antigen/teichoic acid export membrane protein
VSAAPGRSARLVVPGRVGRVGRLARGRVGAAVLSQAVVAVSGLALQLVAARTLGLRGYGAYVLCFGVLVTVTAVFTGFVGDSLTVLDRFDPHVRAALATVAAAGTVAGAVLDGVVAFVVDGGGTAAGWTFALATAIWLVREVGRRVLMARLSFWRLLVADAVAVAVTLAPLAGYLAAGGPAGLTVIFAAMAVGNAVAALLATAMLPRAERLVPRPGWSGLRAVAGFATWRSLQVGLRPGTLVVVRLLVAATGGLAAVGLLEAGRLILAPVQTVVNSAGSVLLSGGAAARRAGRSASRWTTRASVLLVGAAVAGGVLGAVFAGPVGNAVIGRPAPVGLVLGWAGFLAVAAATLPYATEVTVHERSRTVFGIRLADSLSAVVLVAVIGALGLGVAWVPWSMAAAGAAWFVVLHRVAIRLRREPAGHQPRPGVTASAAPGAGWSA